MKKKKTYLELLRILAIFFVIFNHTGSNGFTLYATLSSNTLLYWVSLFISIFCKFSVPVFFMISGALMLNKNSVSLINIYKNKILPTVIILLMTSFIYYAKSFIFNFDGFDLDVFFEVLYSSRHSVHLWYLYAYIAFLMSLPFLHLLAQKMKDNDYIYLFFLSIVFVSIIPTLEHFIFNSKITMNENLKPNFLFSNIFIYPLIGYYIDCIMDNKIKRTHILKLWVVNIIAIILSCVMANNLYKSSGVALETYHNTYVILNAIAIFSTVKYSFNTCIELDKIENIILKLGSLTFGIYLIHPLILYRDFVNTILFNLIGFGVNKLIAILITCTLVYSLCCIIVYVIKKIPFIKKYI